MPLAVLMDTTNLHYPLKQDAGWVVVKGGGALATLLLLKQQPWPS